MNIMGDFNLLQSPVLKTRSHYHYQFNVLLLVFRVTQSKEEPLRSCTSTSKTDMCLLLNTLNLSHFDLKNGIGIIGTDLIGQRR